MNNTFCNVCGNIVPIGERCSCSPKIKSESSKNHPSATKRFQKLRKRILNRDNYTCQRCIKFDRHDESIHEDLQCHHIKSWRDYPELAYDENNLIIVCQSCNLKLGNSNVLDFEWQPKRKPIIL
ncbi:HNH endonuclease [Bacillus wiedmannii]|uniref:HNH endonuclease n=1 Tax=Bacillus wiedmannii TaxID=1890302 RepID=UPI000BF906AD|nr:HNH endonuclease [Bacillus wiedmannii]PGC57705.1 HNH endonuclease [Bacillus wiedmannii]